MSELKYEPYNFSRCQLTLPWQLKIWSDQVGRLVEDGWQNSTSLGDAQRRLTDIEREYQQIKQSLGERQSNAASSRQEVAELLIKLEKERYSRSYFCSF